MRKIAVLAVPVFAFYLWLTAGPGETGWLWTGPELVLGVAASLFASILSVRHMGADQVIGSWNPVRWFTMIGYMIGPFFLELAKANLDVARRVITGDIHPGVIRVKTGMSTDFSTTTLANSITLTPGTLTLDVDPETNDLFVHKINLAPGEETKAVWESRELFGLDLPAWIRRFAE